MARPGTGRCRSAEKSRRREMSARRGASGRHTIHARRRAHARQGSQWRIVQDLGVSCGHVSGRPIPQAVAHSRADPCVVRLGTWPWPANGAGVGCGGHAFLHTARGGVGAASRARMDRSRGHGWSAGWRVASTAAPIKPVLNGTAGRQVAVLAVQLGPSTRACTSGLAEAIVDSRGARGDRATSGRAGGAMDVCLAQPDFDGPGADHGRHSKSRARGSLISARCAFDQNRDVFALWQRGMGAFVVGKSGLGRRPIGAPVDRASTTCGGHAEAESSVAAIKRARRWDCGDGVSEKVWSRWDARRAHPTVGCFRS